MTVADWLRDEGRKEGRKEGLDEGVRTTLLKQLRKRFGAVPEVAEARIAKADLPQLETWVDRVLDAASLDEVLAAG